MLKLEKTAGSHTDRHSGVPGVDDVSGVTQAAQSADEAQLAHAANMVEVAKVDLRELFLEAQAGNEISLNLLVDRFYMDIYRTVYYRVSSEADAQDLTQDIFIKMAEKIRSLKDPDKFKAWIYKIAVNKINDYFRKKRFLSFISLNSEEEPLELKDHRNPENDYIKKDFWIKLRQFTESLSNMERQVFILRFFDQLEIKEIVEVLNKNESTIKTHLYRAINKFKNADGLRGFISGVQAHDYAAQKERSAI